MARSVGRWSLALLAMPFAASLVQHVVAASSEPWAHNDTTAQCRLRSASSGADDLASRVPSLLQAGTVSGLKVVATEGLQPVVVPSDPIVGKAAAQVHTSSPVLVASPASADQASTSSTRVAAMVAALDQVCTMAISLSREARTSLIDHSTRIKRKLIFMSKGSQVHLIWLVMPCVLCAFSVSCLFATTIGEQVTREIGLRQSGLPTEKMPDGGATTYVRNRLPAPSSTSSSITEGTNGRHGDAPPGGAFPGGAATGSGQASEEPALSPPLRVPPGQECALLAPIRKLTHDPVEITDIHGRAVLRVMATGETDLVLQSADGQTLARCHTASPNQVSFHRSCGEYYGTLKLTSAGDFLLVTRGGTKLRVSGSFETGWSISQVDGNLMAYAERYRTDASSEKCLITVLPEVDAGLMFCTFFCALASQNGFHGEVV